MHRHLRALYVTKEEGGPYRHSHTKLHVSPSSTLYYVLSTRFGLIWVMKSLPGATQRAPQGEGKTEGLELLLIPTPSFSASITGWAILQQREDQGTENIPVFMALRQNTKHLLDGHSEQEVVIVSTVSPYWRHRHQGTAW